MNFGYIPTHLNGFTTPVFRGACPSNWIVRDTWEDDLNSHVERITVTVCKEFGGSYSTALYVSWNDRPGTLIINGAWDTAKEARTHYKTLCKLFIKVLKEPNFVIEAGKFVQTIEPKRLPYVSEIEIN